MKTITVALPAKLAQELDTMVKSGWFSSEEELVRMALMEFLRRNHPAMVEQFQREDIAWALEQKGAKE